ncbi:MAG: HTH domain-containing protein [Bacteroidetes bacterium]|nr:HTH domain-containing protein [Bacteroidota bacterium]
MGKSGSKCCKNRRCHRRQKTNNSKNIQGNPEITTTKIAKTLNVTRRTIARDIDKLKRGEIIIRVGSDKLGYWKMIENYVCCLIKIFTIVGNNLAIMLLKVG